MLTPEKRMLSMTWNEQAEMEALATSVRKVARLLWALHLSFLDGFDEVRSPQTMRPVAIVVLDGAKTGTCCDGSLQWWCGMGIKLLLWQREYKVFNRL